MDLISRNALVDLAKSERETCGNDYDFDGLLSDIENAPTVPAVPLDKLCKWLGEHAVPPVSDCLLTDEARTAAWKAILNKFLEEQYD